MPKRSEKRDTAKAEYIAKKKKGEEVSLRTLAGELGVSYQSCTERQKPTLAAQILERRKHSANL